MVINEKKDKRQEEALNHWLESNASACVTAITGFGKTRIAVKAISRLNKKSPEKRTLIVVPTLKLKEDWEKEVTTNDLKECRVVVLSGLARHLTPLVSQTIDFDLLVVDEVHRILNEDSENFKLVLDRVSHDFFLGLSATLNDNHIEFLEQRNIPICDTISQEECEREGYVTKTKMFNLGIAMSEEDEIAYEKLHTQFNQSFSKFGNNFDLAMGCVIGENMKRKHNGVWMTGGQIRKNYAAKMGWDGTKEHGWSPYNIMRVAQVFNASMQGRKKFLYNASSKLDTIKEISEVLNLKTIVFAQSTDFADKLVEKLGSDISCVYHSKQKVKDKKQSLEDFEFGGKQVLSTVKALQEGFNVESVECSILAAYTTSKIAATQSRGRSMRIDINNPAKVAYIIHLYMKGTQEEKWLKAALSGEKNVKWISDIKELLC